MKNAQYNSKDVKNTCESKLRINFRDGKEYNGWFEYSGRKICRITIPKGRKFLPKGTYSSMARQLKLTVNQFDELLDCPLTFDRYAKIVS